MTEPMWLISGSQDGTMKCFDLRIKEAARTFYRQVLSIMLFFWYHDCFIQQP